MDLITSEIKTENGTATFIWHPDIILDDVLATQTYGFCLTDDNKVVLVRDRAKTTFSLPGGGVEKGETPRETLIREFHEEAEFTPIDIKLMGSQEVIERDFDGNVIKHSQHVRFFCRPDKIKDFISEKDGWEIIERIFVKPNEVAKYIHWIETPGGKAQFEYFLQLAKLTD